LFFKGVFKIEQNGIGLAGWLVIIGGGITLAALVGGIIKMLKHLFLTAGIDQKKSEILAVLLITGCITIMCYKSFTSIAYLFHFLEGGAGQ